MTMVSKIFRCGVFLLLLYGMGLGRRIIDLTHTLDKDAPQYPLFWENLTYYNIELREGHPPGETEGMWVGIGRVEFYEHIGSHMDAPKHFGQGRQSMAEIPAERLVGPGVVLNVKEKARADPNYAVTLNDVLEYEEKYGRIPSGSIVMMNSGWSIYYPSPVIYLGTTNITDVTSLNFPGFGLDACEFLLTERQISIIGVDTMSVDPGQPERVYGFPYPCHHHLQPNNVPLLENVANLDSIPPKGTTIFLGGLKTRTGTGGPTRILAIIDDESGTVSNFAETNCQLFFNLPLSLIIAKQVLQ